MRTHENWVPAIRTLVSNSSANAAFEPGLNMSKFGIGQACTHVTGSS